VLLLPSLTASAFFYKKLPPDLQTDLQSTLRKVEAWSQNEYSVALMKGDRLKGDERQAVITQLARFTGLDPSLIVKSDLRVNADTFARGLFREQNLELGHYGAHMNWKMTSPNAPYDLWLDPSLVSNGVNALIVPYLRSELGFSVDTRYAGPWGGGWPSPTTPRGDWTGLNWDRAGTNANINLGAGLADAMRRNPTLRIFVIQGYYDLVTPYFSGEYFVSHLGLDPAERRNVLFANYPGGHTMYTEKTTLHQMSIDVGEFIKNTVPAKRPTPSVQP
jgi:carboxypeptidase C (cathepsin A)